MNSTDGDGRRGSYRTYDVDLPLTIVAHSEAQAKERVEQIRDFLYALQTEWEFPHDAVRFVWNYGEPKNVTFVEERIVNESDFQGSMLSNMEYLHDWIDPHAGMDFDASRLAARAFFGDEEE